MKTLISVEPYVNGAVEKNPTSRNTCYCIYGFDIMVDDKLKPWLLEVNAVPSFASSSPMDKRIKTMLMCDTLTLVGIRPYQKAKMHALDDDEVKLGPFRKSMSFK